MAVKYKVKGAYPFSFGAPNITYEVTWYLNYNKTDNKLEVKVIGSHSEFPAFEAIVDDKLLYGDKPTAGGPGFFNVGVFWDEFNTKWKSF